MGNGFETASKYPGGLNMNPAGFGRAFLAMVCVVWLVACAHSDETRSDAGASKVLVEDQVGFDFADGIRLPEDWTQEQKVFALKNFRVGNGPNRILIAGVQFELQGNEAADRTMVSSVAYGGRELTLIPGSEVLVSWMWKGTEIWLKVALYYLLNPPSGSHDLTVTYVGPVPSGNVGAISLYNTKQTLPIILANNHQEDRQKEIITQITTKTDGAWVVDFIACNHKSDLEPQTKGHIRRFSAQEFVGGKSSLLGGTLPVTAAGETTLHWAMKKHNRLAHIVLQIDYQR